jgi:hypothetical protein
MGLYFQNQTNLPVWVCFAYYRPGCEGGVDWDKKGWYEVSPGQTVKVWSGWAGNNTFLFYAEDGAGGVWEGPFPTFVPWNAFDWCWNTASNDGRTLGFRNFSVSWEYMDYTIQLNL